MESDFGIEFRCVEYHREMDQNSIRGIWLKFSSDVNYFLFIRQHSSRSIWK